MSRTPTVLFFALIAAQDSAARSGITVEKLLGPAVTLLAAFVAVIGVWSGATAALNRYKRERVFERRLDWYERMLRILVKLALELEVAATIEEQGIERGSEARADWSPVQQTQLDFIRIAAETDLYGSGETVRLVRRAERAVQRAADDTDAFDTPRPRLRRVWALARLLKRVARLVSANARVHFELVNSGR